MASLHGNFELCAWAFRRVLFRSYLADLNDENPEWYAGRKAFIAAFPGLILGFFKVADVPAISVPAMYGQLALYAGVSALAFLAADAFLPVSSHKLTTLWAAAALNIFYWFGFPVIYKAITNQHAPGGATWAARVVVFGLTAFWVVRTYVKERAFVERAGGAKPGRGAGGRSSVSHS